MKNNVRNKAKVKGPISSVYFVEETSSFCSCYFEDHASMKHKNVSWNDNGDGYVVYEHEEVISIFKYFGWTFSNAKTRYITNEKFKLTRTYVLLNSSEIEPFIY